MNPSKDILNRIREARQQGWSLNRICKELQLSAAMVCRWARGGWTANG